MAPRIVVALALAAGLLAPTGVGAAKKHSVEVAHGRSPSGVPWQIQARRGVAHTAEFHFSFDPPGYDDAGYSTQLPLPLPRRFVFTASSGSSISPFAEGDLSGIAVRRAVALRVRMSDASKRTVEPRRAPRGVRERFAWLRGLRFFDLFFPASLEPKVVTALNERGRVLDRRRSQQGSF